MISKEVEATIEMERITTLAGGLGIRRHELPGLLSELQSNGLIHYNDSGATILAVSQQSLLGHATHIFEGLQPSGLEYAALDLAERGSLAPLRREDCEEELADTYSLSASERDDLFRQSEEIGFTDYEGTGTDKLYFNGSLFRRESARKAKFLLEGLGANDTAKVVEVDDLLRKRGCVPAGEIKKILGARLWSSLHQIAHYDVVWVRNEKGVTEFATKPDAISKYVPNGIADVLDDAKALAAGLTYGMVKSDHARGKIRDPSALMNSFLGKGYLEGPVRALVEDYKLLEKRGVVQVTTTAKGYKMSIQKPEVGRMARDLILRGDANLVAAEVAVGNTAAQFAGPDSVRLIERKKSIPEAQSLVSRSLNILRKS